MCKYNTLAFFNKLTNRIYFLIIIRNGIYTKTICKTNDYHLILIKHIFIFCKCILILLCIHSFYFNFKAIYSSKHSHKLCIFIQFPGNRCVTVCLRGELQNVYYLFLFILICRTFCKAGSGSTDCRIIIIANLQLPCNNLIIIFWNFSCQSIFFSNFQMIFSILFSNHITRRILYLYIF